MLLGEIGLAGGPRDLGSQHVGRERELGRTGQDGIGHQSVEHPGHRLVGLDELATAKPLGRVIDPLGETHSDLGLSPRQLERDPDPRPLVGAIDHHARVVGLAPRPGDGVDHPLPDRALTRSLAVPYDSDRARPIGDGRPVRYLRHVRRTRERGGCRALRSSRATSRRRNSETTHR